MIFGKNEKNTSPTTPKLMSKFFGTWKKTPLARKDLRILGRAYLLYRAYRSVNLKVKGCKKE
jgi:hypothetical protein